MQLEVLEGVEPDWGVGATVLLLAGCLLVIHKYATRNFGKWERMEIPFQKGHFPYGSFNIFSLKRHFFEHMTDLHLKFRSERYVGWFLMDRPVLNINDPELIRSIMVKDFNQFTERSGYDGETFKVCGQYDKLWGRQMSGLQGEEWRRVRAAFSPMFTSGKMKARMGVIRGSADRLVQELDRRAEGEEHIPLKVCCE
jgi:cytochrome P450 family 6